MTTDAMTAAPAAQPQPRWLRRVCERWNGWCALLLDAHHARIPF